MKIFNHAAIALIHMYRMTFGKLLPGRCRFYPSCSVYAEECFERFGFLHALFKSAYRILRCTPLSKGYFDPVVPEHEHSHAPALTQKGISNG